MAAARSLRRISGIAELVNPQGGPFKHRDRQFEFSPHGLDIAAKRGEIHINLPLDLGSRRVVDVEGGRDLRLRLAGDLPLFAPTFHLQSSVALNDRLSHRPSAVWTASIASVLWVPVGMTLVAGCLLML